MGSTKLTATQIFLSQLRQASIQEPFREYRFDPDRRWKFDFAWPLDKLAVEIEGIFYRPKQGLSRHQRGPGFERDLSKYNVAVLAGWRLLRFSPGNVRKGCAIEAVKKALAEPRPLSGENV